MLSQQATSQGAAMSHEQPFQYKVLKNFPLMFSLCFRIEWSTEFEIMKIQHKVSKGKC